MTTLRVKFERNLIGNSEFPIFDSAQEPGSIRTSADEQLCGLFISSARGANEPFRQAIERCASVLRPLIFNSKALHGSRPFLFAADSVGREDTVIARHQGFWLRPWVRDLLGNLVQRGVSLALPSEEGIRYIGLVDVREEELDATMDFAREHGQAAVLLSNQDLLSDDWIGTLAERVYPRSMSPKERSINWLRLCIELSRLGIVGVRVTGQFDDREVLVAIYGICQTVSYVFDEAIRKGAAHNS